PLPSCRTSLFFFLPLLPPPPRPTLFPYTTLFRSSPARELHSRTREGPPRFKGYSEFVISIHFCYLGHENHLPRPSYPSSGRENQDRKSTRLNSSHVSISYAVFCLKKKTHHITNNA